MARPTTYSPLIIPIVRACATFGATAEEIANYLNIPWGSFKRWIYAEPELREALKRGRDASDERVVESLYQQALAGNVGAICFWLKNCRPGEWRDVQHLDQAVGHYIEMIGGFLSRVCVHHTQADAYGCCMALPGTRGGRVA